jgi:lysine 6-dehydrogenase
LKILVLGIGKIGTALLKDLSSCEEVSEVVAGDVDVKTVKRKLEGLKSAKMRPERVDVKDRKSLKKILAEDFDVVASSLPSALNYDVIKTTIEAGVNYTDVLSEPWDLHKLAENAGVTVLPSIGLDPGIDRVMEGTGAAKLDKVTEIHQYCGGFPQKNTPAYNNPIKYKVTWDWNLALDGYLGFPDLYGGKRGKTKILRAGEIVEVDVLSGPRNPQIIKFPEPLGELEAFFTGAPWDTIEQLGLKNVREATEKTVRWPGNCQIWSKLIDLHLLDHETLTVKGQKVEPRDLLIEIGNKYLQYEKGEGDAVVVRVEVIGEKNNRPTKYTYELMDFYDPIADITSMGRTTAFPCSIASQMLARGEIKEKGVLHPAKIALDPSLRNRFFEELAKRNIQIAESVTTMMV